MQIPAELLSLGRVILLPRFLALKRLANSQEDLDDASEEIFFDFLDDCVGVLDGEVGDISQGALLAGYVLLEVFVAGPGRGLACGWMLVDGVDRKGRDGLGTFGRFRLHGFVIDVDIEHAVVEEVVLAGSGGLLSD